MKRNFVIRLLSTIELKKGKQTSKNKIYGQLFVSLKLEIIKYALIFHFNHIPGANAC